MGILSLVMSTEFILGDGYYHLEFDNVSNRHFRWTSDEFFLHIIVKNDGFVNTLVLFNTHHGNSLININGIDHPIVTGDNRVKVFGEYVVIKTPYFTPNDIDNQNADMRKLGLQFLGIEHEDQFISVDKIETIKKSFHSIRIESIFPSCETKIDNTNVVLIKIPPNTENGKLNLGWQTGFSTHRSGWNYVLKLLTDFSSENATVKVDGFLENNFIWNATSCILNKTIPYTTPWIGFIHNPPDSPMWIIKDDYVEKMVLSKPFQESLKCCMGLYTFSNHSKKIIQSFLPVDFPLEHLYHPTEFLPDNQCFSIENFNDNPNKSIVSLGYWLRRQFNFYRLKSPYKKIRFKSVEPIELNRISQQFFVEQTALKANVSDEEINSVEFKNFVSNSEYDQFLSKNIAFLDLYASNANNSIIECMVRNTPLLINRLPSIEEYLGEDYPFYFSNRSEAERKLNDLDLIEETYLYLRDSGVKHKLSKEHFSKSIIKSRIYKSL